MKKWMNLVKGSLLAMTIALSTSCGNQSTGIPQINGIKGPNFNVVDGQVLMTIKMLNMQVDAGFKMPIPKTKHSFVEFAPNVLDGGMVLSVYMDVEDLKTINVGIGDGNYLPDGRALPGIPGGRLDNSLRVDTDWHDISFYYHQKLFGIWIPVGFETAGLSGSWNIRMQDKSIGLIGLVGNDEYRDYKAGAIVLLNLDMLKDKDLKKVINLSKRNPRTLY